MSFLKFVVNFWQYVPPAHEYLCPSHTTVLDPPVLHRAFQGLSNVFFSVSFYLAPKNPEMILLLFYNTDHTRRDLLTPLTDLLASSADRLSPHDRPVCDSPGRDCALPIVTPPPQRTVAVKVLLYAAPAARPVFGRTDPGNMSRETFESLERTNLVG